MAVPQRFVPDIDELRNFYVGKRIDEVPKPSIVLDRSKMQKHCDTLTKAVNALGVGFRFHVKSHKTSEGTRLQAGHTSCPIKLATSTIPEIEHILPLLQEFQLAGRSVNVLYAIPFLQSQIQRLAALGRQLGPGTISVLIDHPVQLRYVVEFARAAGFVAGVYVKIDTGYHRAGLPPAGANKDDLLVQLMRLERCGQAELIGLYSHSSLSYHGATPREAIKSLEDEITGCLDTLRRNADLFPHGKHITISVGASPQVTSVENLLNPSTNEVGLREDAEHLRDIIHQVNTDPTAGIWTKLELHAGVYSLLDVQQISTHSREALLGDYEDEIAVSVVAEVCSVYNDGERRQPEALIAVGTLGLGREPCTASSGWGVLHRSMCGGFKGSSRLIIDRISQEHAIVSWDGPEIGGHALPIPLEVGQSVRIFPNHACVTGALYGWYLVVDSSSGDENQIMDVWIRASGW